MQRCNQAVHYRREENARRHWKSDAQTAGKPNRGYHKGEWIRAFAAAAAVAALALTAMWSYGVAYDLGYENGYSYAQKAEL